LKGAKKSNNGEEKSLFAQQKLYSPSKQARDEKEQMEKRIALYGMI
jgi:hypothetical protein